MKINPIDVMLQTKLASKAIAVPQRLKDSTIGLSLPGGLIASVDDVRHRLLTMYPRATGIEVDRAIKNAIGRGLVGLVGDTLQVVREKELGEEKEPVCIPYKIQLDPAALVAQTGIDELVNFIGDLATHAHSDEVDEALFKYAMKKFIADVEDDRNEDELLLDMDELVKEYYEEYKKAWNSR